MEAQSNLECQIDVRTRKLIWYAQAHVVFVGASAYQIGVRRRNSIRFAQAQAKLICAGAGYVTFVSTFAKPSNAPTK